MDRNARQRIPRVTRADGMLFRGMLFYTVLTLLILLALVFVAQVMDKAGSLGQGHLGWRDLLLYIALQMPKVAYDILPLALLLGALTWLTILAGHSELVALRMAGWSPARLERPLLAVAILGGFTVFALGQWVVPYSAPASEALWASSTNPGHGFHYLGKQGLWLRDGTDLVRIAAVGDDGRRLQDVTIFRMQDNLTAVRSLMEAKGAAFSGGQWWLEGVQRIAFASDRLETTEVPRLAWQSTLQPVALQSFAHDPRTMTLQDLWQTYSSLQTSALTANRFALALWQRLSYPLVGVIMVMLAVPFAIRSHRGGGLAARLLMGLILGLAFHFLNLMGGYISVAGGLPPVAATLAPLVLFAILALFLQTQAR